MTQNEQVLVLLQGSNGGMTATQVREKLDIDSNVLATLLWELKKNGYIARVGGARGSYIYDITQKGRTMLPGSHRDPLTKLADALQGEAVGEASAFPELMMLVKQLEDYKLLRRYNSWLATSEASPLSPMKDPLTSELDTAVLRFLGVNPEAYQEQRQALDSLLTLV